MVHASVLYFFSKLLILLVLTCPSLSERSLSSGSQIHLSIRSKDDFMRTSPFADFTFDIQISESLDDTRSSHLSHFLQSQIEDNCRKSSPSDDSPNNQAYEYLTLSIRPNAKTMRRRLRGSSASVKNAIYYGMDDRFDSMDNFPIAIDAHKMAISTSSRVKLTNKIKKKGEEHKTRGFLILKPKLLVTTTLPSKTSGLSTKVANSAHTHAEMVALKKEEDKAEKLNFEKAYTPWHSGVISDEPIPSDAYAENAQRKHHFDQLHAIVNAAVRRAKAEYAEILKRRKRREVEEKSMSHSSGGNPRDSKRISNKSRDDLTQKFNIELALNRAQKQENKAKILYEYASGLLRGKYVRPFASKDAVGYTEHQYRIYRTCAAKNLVSATNRVMAIKDSEVYHRLFGRKSTTTTKPPSNRKSTKFEDNSHSVSVGSILRHNKQLQSYLHSLRQTIGQRKVKITKLKEKVKEIGALSRKVIQTLESDASRLQEWKQNIFVDYTHRRTDSDPVAEQSTADLAALLEKQKEYVKRNRVGMVERSFGTDSENVGLKYEKHSARHVKLRELAMLVPTLSGDVEDFLTNSFGWDKKAQYEKFEKTIKDAVADETKRINDFVLSLEADTDGGLGWFLEEQQALVAWMSAY